ncbi:hypothetical protein HanXRQr2_Chr17g0796921 [Helianthus annuus]|uniref:Uncharacterized protein n=1 Tax=Helianthus annuus TaxID=4232 RepID=A0A9K3DGL0_HELAN|nr:hypothetical protein HanXRQr2_Chr17g0796921 [Helianthus annuus]KAJ0812681.1 hypothetical protein HanPSC8_Chr17g0764661 [Helianthus annuus]
MFPSRSITSNFFIPKISSGISPLISLKGSDKTLSSESFGIAYDNLPINLALPIKQLFLIPNPYN